MKAIIEVEFEIEEGNHFSVENIVKAISSNLSLREMPMVERTREGHITVRIFKATVIRIDGKEVP